MLKCIQFVISRIAILFLDVAKCENDLILISAEIRQKKKRKEKVHIVG